jgi:phosphate transport system substrate-binding protein
VKRLTTLAAVVALALLSPGCGRGQREERLTGGGSSFVNLIMKKWASAYYKDKGIQIDYTSSGSGNGIQQMIQQKNDFGCTDAPMSKEQLAKARAAGGEVLHVPLVIGGVVPAYNLPGVKQPLRFTGPVLADIFLGKIKKWNEPPLKELNPMADLPDQEIAVVHRSDGSGTTYIWAYYLSKVSPAWKNKVGVGTDLSWPAGIGVPKNDGVAGQIGRTPGALGYVELGYALTNDIQYGAVKNPSKEYVRANLESVTKAGEGVKTESPDDLLDHLTGSPARGAYPICGATWAVLYVKQPPERARLLGDFLRWCTHDGQDYTRENQYARLPAELVRQADGLLDRLSARK